MTDDERTGAREERKKRLQDFQREHILAAAIKLAQEGGLKALTMEEVARRSGFSVGSLYSYFRSKDELGVEILLAKAAEVQEVLKLKAPEGLSARDTLVWYVAGMLKRIWASKGIIVDMVSRIHDAGTKNTRLESGRSHEIMRTQDENLVAAMRSLLPGVDTTVSAEDAGCALGGLMRAFVAQELLLGGADPKPLPDEQELARKIVNLLWFGLVGAPKESKT